MRKNTRGQEAGSETKCFTVIGNFLNTGNYFKVEVEAVDTITAFSAAVTLMSASEDDLSNIEFAAALPGKFDWEIFPGESVVDGQTIADQPEVFGGSKISAPAAKLPGLTVEELLNKALNAACAAVQDAVGESAGDLAGAYFSDPSTFNTVMKPYCTAELQMALQRASKAEMFAIEVYGYPRTTYLAIDSDEEDGEGQTDFPITTTPTLAVPFETQGEADDYMQKLVRRFPAKSFRVKPLNQFDLAGD